MSDYPDGDFIKAAARAAELRAADEQPATDSEPTTVDPLIEVLTIGDYPEGEDGPRGEPLGGFMRIRTGDAAFTMILSCQSVADLHSSLGRVLDNKAAWDQSLGQTHLASSST